MHKKLLVVTAHPDDESLEVAGGCVGILNMV